MFPIHQIQRSWCITRGFVMQTKVEKMVGTILENHHVPYYQNFLYSEVQFLLELIENKCSELTHSCSIHLL